MDQEGARGTWGEAERGRDGTKGEGKGRQRRDGEKGRGGGHGVR